MAVKAKLREKKKPQDEEVEEAVSQTVVRWVTNEASHCLLVADAHQMPPMMVQYAKTAFAHFVNNDASLVDDFIIVSPRGGLALTRDH